MRKSLPILLAGLLAGVAAAQSPDKFSYQAVIRSSNQQLVTNAIVSVRISILQDSSTGQKVYEELKTPLTNANGLISMEIGGGQGFDTINWANGPFFIKTETDPTGGTNYTLSGTQQLLSVPYALHSKTAEMISGGITETDPVFGASVASGITGTDTTNWNNKQDKLNTGPGINIFGDTISTYVWSLHYVGELYGGGVVFWVDQTGNHGLICSMIDISNAQAWSDTNTLIGAPAQSDWDGQSNTNAIIAQSISTSAADLCDVYTNANYGTGVFSDWYLPSRGELNDLWNNIKAVQKALDTDGNPATTVIKGEYYLSSTEYNYSSPYSFFFGDGHATKNMSKGYAGYVRAVRAF
jgi:hypothetical protein